MKSNRKRLLALILTVSYLMVFIPITVFSQNDIINFTFEASGEGSMWIGAVVDEAASYEGLGGIVVSNPYGDPSTGVFGHILEYNDFIHLEEGCFYTFSAYIANPLADDMSEPSASAYMGRGGNALFIDISNVGFNWGFVSASFMATETVDASFVVSISGGDEDIGFFMDNISITPETRIPAYSVLEGPEHVFIPENGYAEYRYNIVTYDENDEAINVLINDLNITAKDLPYGVEFDTSSGVLKVHSFAEAEKSFTVTCGSAEAFDLTEYSKTITATKNLLSDPGFENGEDNWISGNDMQYEGGILSLYAKEKGDYGYYSSITYTKQLLLRSGNMYVFRADVGSDEEYAASAVYISNLSFAQSGYAEINITGVGGEWSNVTSAFIVEDTGLYDLTINLYAPTQRPIYIDNVYLGSEEAEPSSISIHAPGHVQIPSFSTVLPCYCVVRDQMGQPLEDLECTVSISPENQGVYWEDGEVFVTAGAKSDDYTVTAAFGDILSSHVITVSDNFIGDGGFEEKQPDEWWTSSEGSSFSIIEYNGSKAGHIYSSDTSCILINNSYMELIQGEYYVYSAAAGFGKGTVTAFINDYETGDYIPFAQYDPSEGVRIPFSVDRNVLGRLVLYIESDDFVGIIIDDLAIELGELSASVVVVSGGGYGDYIHGSYVYNNNMTNNSDANISSTRWYISPTADGPFQPVGVPNQDYLEFTPDMAGQFVIYEVTPICAYTGLEGDIVRSLPLEISSDNQSGLVDEPVSKMTPIEPNDNTNHYFSDITSHWAEKMIASLANSGIVSGKDSRHFYPDHYITRAEFTAMIARAFSLVSIPYTGTFSDVSSSDWYCGIIETAYNKGIIKGVSEDCFAPNDRITREQMAVIITRAYLMCDGPLPYEMDLTYYDSFRISPWAYDSVKMSSNLNLFAGDDMNLFRPLDSATRGEAAVCIYRMLKSFQY